MRKITILFLFLVILFTGCNNKQTYTITWKNYDGSILEIDENVEEGVLPTYDKELPIKESDGQYRYVFMGWTPIVEEAIADGVYYATYEAEYMHSEYNGSYVLSHIITESITSGNKITYNIGDRYFGVILTQNFITAEINNGAGQMTFTNKETKSHDFTYIVLKDKIVINCEEGIDLFGKGDKLTKLDILLEQVGENKYFVLNASNGVYNFSYYLMPKTN